MLTASHWPADTSGPLASHTVGSLLREVAAARPDQVALVSVPEEGESRRWTYAELLGEAERIAAGISERVPLGGRVALWAPNVAEWPIVEYAAALASVTLVALNPALRARELVHALRTSASTMLLYAERSRSYDMAAVLESVRGELPLLEHAVPLSDWEGLYGSSPVPAEREDAASAVPAQIQFTSGTTGLPKAVLLSHQAVVNVSRFTFDVLGIREAAPVVSPLPMFHTAGCVISCLGPLWCGGPFILLERFDPHLLLKVLRDTPDAVLTSVPTVLTALVEAARREDVDTPAVGAVLTGGAPVRSRLIGEVEQLFATTVFNLYGQTELASVLTLTRPQDSKGEKSATVGRPLPHVECRITHPEYGHTQPLDAPGEICARGYQQMLGYFGDPEATAAKTDEDGWLYTGDLGSMDATGAVRIIGRLSDVIIRGGENIAAAEIEECLLREEAVQEAVVVGIPDEAWGEIVAAGLLPAPGRTVDVEKMRAACQEWLSPYKVPQLWYLLDELPTTPSGKVQKFRVKEFMTQTPPVLQP
ncbi:class I adenylate-forming enzyme family protein [Streptomyces vinaceus]|uniref:class I adenylate-forming enzyme family protein n=1 Tax=Streptomyces vinaceus TaxID=1960 RepID=UPI001AD61AEE|nr:AMP-binding protein [Streptomyces vinaceus]